MAGFGESTGESSLEEDTRFYSSRKENRPSGQHLFVILGNHQNAAAKMYRESCPVWMFQHALLHGIEGRTAAKDVQQKRQSRSSRKYNGIAVHKVVGFKGTKPRIVAL
jgi:hypothetical protein